jgi:hypothetical protein
MHRLVLVNSRSSEAKIGPAMITVYDHQDVPPRVVIRESSGINLQ